MAVTSQLSAILQQWKSKVCLCIRKHSDHSRYPGRQKEADGSQQTHDDEHPQEDSVNHHRYIFPVLLDLWNGKTRGQMTDSMFLTKGSFGHLGINYRYKQFTRGYTLFLYKVPKTFHQYVCFLGIEPRRNTWL